MDNNLMSPYGKQYFIFLLAKQAQLVANFLLHFAGNVECASNVHYWSIYTSNYDCRALLF
jgi:hypothetical protein